MKNSKIILIGCGLIAQSMHLPAIMKYFKKNDIALADKNLDTLNKISKVFGIQNFYKDLEEIDFSEYSYAVLAVPYQLNYEILSLLLNYKIKILCEKPVVSHYQDYNLLKDKLNNSQSEIFINQTRRFSPLAKSIKKIIQSKTDPFDLGELISVSYNDGSKFDWDSSSGFYFQNQFGVLMDRGPHALDLISWMIDDKLQIVHFYKDSINPFPESHTHLKLLSFKKNISIDVTLSWKYKLANQVAINFQNGTILFGVNDLNSFEIVSNQKRKTVIADNIVDHYYDLGKVVMRNFLDSSKESVSFFDVENSIRLISEAYEK